MRTLTAAAVARIKSPQRGQTDHFDKGYPGLALRLSYGGARSWVFFYRLHGTQRRLTLGRFPAMGLADAREAWRVAREMVAKGENPAQARPARADNFDAVVAEWLKRDQGQNRSEPHVRAAVERYLLPAWGGRPIASIKRRDVLELINSVVDRGRPAMAHRMHAHVHRMFRWCVGRGIVEVNPVADLPRQGSVVQRDRVLTDAELALVWRAATDMAWPFGPLFRLLILTACRRDEIGALRWSEIDGDTIRLEGARVKSGQARSIALSPQAVAIVETLPRMAGSDLVFASTRNTPVATYSRGKALLDGAVAKLNDGETLPPWRTHDLRRTAATGMQRLGVNLQVVETVLGHTSGSRSGVIGIYQRHQYGPEARAALTAWGAHVEALVDGKPATVLPMTRGRR